MGRANASDTADLFMGRGESADKPFANLAAAVTYATRNYAGLYRITIILHADDSITDMGINAGNLGSLVIQGDDSARKITLGTSISIGSDNISFNNISMVSNGAQHFLCVQGHTAMLYVGANVTFSGAMSKAAIRMTNIGNALIAPIAATVTGKCYNLERWSRLVTTGPDAIPGTCDATSVYA